MKKVFALLFLSFSMNTFADVASSAVAQARAAELSSHRIERLVNLKKIDSNFIAKLKSIEIQRLNQSQVTDPLFLSTVSQYEGADGTRNQVELFMDDQGKTLNYNVKSGSASVNAPTWPDKDPSTLVENGLHFVLEHNVEKPELKPFYDSLISMNLSKTTKDGQEVAMISIASKDVQSILNVFIKFDGSFVGYEIK
jgi:hypothetical protein